MNTPVEPSENLSPLERYQVFRSRIEHEDNLIMQRLSWLMASQSFLFTAYAIVTNGLSSLSPSSGPIFITRLHTLEDIVPIVALLNSFFILISILGAIKAILEVRRRYKQQPEILKCMPLQTSPAARTLGMSAPILLPLIFLAVWIFLLTR
jgi:hypothetical protein